MTPFEVGSWEDVEARWVRGSPERVLDMKRQIQQHLSSHVVNYDNRGLPIDALERHARELDSADLFCNLERIEAGQPLCANRWPTASVCQFLMNRRISADEIRRLKDQLLLHRYEAIPIFFYYNRLLAQFEFDLLHGGRREEVNDGHDLTRAAVALWAADVYVCDAEMANACRKVGMNALTGVAVIPAREPNLFLQRLRSFGDARNKEDSGIMCK
jgi:hypothetical protein